MSFDLRIISHHRGYNAKKVQNYPDLSKLPELPHIDFTNDSKTLIISPHAKTELVKKGFCTADSEYLTDNYWPLAHENKLHLDNFKDFDELSNILKNYDKIVLINALEYLQDIRPILKAAREAIVNSGGQLYVIGNEYAENQPVFGYRQWSIDSVTELLRASGLIVEEENKSKKIYNVTVSCNKKYYESFLQDQNFPSQNFKHLLVTTEHSRYRVTGGIGSYVMECERLYGSDAAILILDNNKDLQLEKINQNKWFAAQLFLDEKTINEYTFANYDTIADIVYETLKSIVFFYEIDSIESQELCLYTTINAKIAGLIPHNIKLVTTCHGSSFHLAKAKRDVLELENIHVAYREKFTIENSDTVYLPTQFLKESYIDSGIKNLEDKSRIIKRLPFDFTRLPRGEEPREYNRLVYIGKTSTIKGFDLFLETLLTLHDKHPEITDYIKEVLIYATSIDIKEKHLLEMYKKVESIYNVRPQSLNREDLLHELAENSKDSLALITYKGDNHAMVVLELLGIGHDFLAAKAGGTPELIPIRFRDNFLVEAEKEPFADSVYDCIFNVKSRINEIKNARLEYINNQTIINSSYTLDNLYSTPALKKSTTRTQPSKDRKILIEIVDTGDKKEIEKTLKSLEFQGVNSEISIVSSPTVFGKIDTDYMRLYAGDTVKQNALRKLQSFLYDDDDKYAVTGFEIVPTYENSKYLGDSFHIPYPPELGSVFLQEKYSRRLLVLFKKGVELLSPDYTDWHRAINLSAKGGRLGVYPELLFELSNKYNFSFNQLENFSKMSHAFSLMPVFDAYIINYQLKRLDDMYFGSKLFNHLEDLYIRKDHPSITYDLSPEMKRLALIYEHRAPKLIKKLVNKSAKASYKTIKKAKVYLKRK